MEIEISFIEQLTPPELFTFEGLLGQGKFQVYMIGSSSQQTKYALKVFPNNSSGTTHYQQEQIISLLCHPNIIKTMPIETQNNEFHYFLTEFAPFGDFCNLAKKGVFQSEILVRTYFHQLIEGIEYLHSQGIAHLDLKLDNLVLGSDYKLKIIDFDQTQSIRDLKMKSNGTIHYRPPEVIDKKCKNLAAVDVYSAGIILYTLIAKQLPFTEAIEKKCTRLYHYPTFLKDNGKFWSFKAYQLRDENLFSRDLIELLNGMLEYDTEKRIKLEDVKSSKWYKGLVIEQESLNTQMKMELEHIFTSECKSE